MENIDTCSGSRSSRNQNVSTELSMISAPFLKLEEYFTKCRSPDKKQVEQWSFDLRAEPELVENWFENRKIMLTAEENNDLRKENGRIRSENLQMRERLKYPHPCSTCQEKELGLLQRENEELREELTLQNGKLRIPYSGRP